MKKSTAAISLVLIGSMAAIYGCSSRDEEDEERGGGGGSHGAHVGHMPIFHGGRTGGGGTATIGGSARGGFGSTGAVGHAGS